MREVVWVRWENIVLPILVLVSEGKFRIFENADRPKVAGGGRNRDDSFRQLQTIRGAAFRPHLQLVPPIRDLVYGDAPFGIRHAVIRRVHGDHDSAHLRMNIAKERTYARAIKSHEFHFDIDGRLLRSGVLPTGTKPYKRCQTTNRQRSNSSRSKHQKMYPTARFT